MRRYALAAVLLVCCSFDKQRTMRDTFVKDTGVVSVVCREVMVTVACDGVLNGRAVSFDCFGLGCRWVQR